MTEITNEPTLAPAQAKELIKQFVKIKQPMLILGDPGAGKSSVCKEAAKELGREFIDIRVGQWEISDVLGIPYMCKETKSMKFAPAFQLPQDPNTRALILLDELNQASDEVQGALFDLILDRKVGNYVLPENVDIVACGNFPTRSSLARPVHAALNNRFVHINMACRADDWLPWAGKPESNVHQWVHDYIEAKGDGALCNYEEGQTVRAFSTPRTWMIISNVCHQLEAEEIDKEIFMSMVSATIGLTEGVKFVNWTEQEVKLPSATSIFNSKGKFSQKAFANANPSERHEFVMQLAEVIRDQQKNMGEKEFNAAVDNVCKLVFNNEIFPIESRATAMQNLIHGSDGKEKVVFNIEEIPELIKFSKLFTA